jgi:creatinine amidohydrolase
MVLERFRVAELTWPEYDALIRGTPVIVPVGATEQHGHHLPLGCDAMHVVAVAEAAAQLADALVAPVLSYGYKSHPRSGGGELFPGTISLDAATIIAAINNVMTQLMTDGARRIVVLSGHYENSMMLHEGIDLSLRGRAADGARILNVLWVDLIPEQIMVDIYPGPYPGVALEHAAFLETSIMLHLRPDLVHPERAGTEVADFPPYDIHPQVEGFVPPTGSLTRSTGATAAVGKRLIDEASVRFAEVLGSAWQ